MKTRTLFFIGDSMIEFCDWQSCFPLHRTVNLGQSGETVNGLLSRLPGLLALRPRPHWLLLMTGTNNVCMEDFAFLPDYETIIDRCRTALPEAVITVNSLLPIALPYLAGNVSGRVNDLLRAMAQRLQVDYLDAHAALLDRAGQPLAGVLAPDGVHLSPRGYQLWAATLQHHLQLLLP